MMVPRVHLNGDTKDSLLRDYQIVRRKFITGAELQHDEKSRSGLYALIDKRKGKTLRISLIPEIAELHRDESRYIAEAWLE